MFTQYELNILAEALNWRIYTGDFSGKDAVPDEYFGTPSHEDDLNKLADKVVSLQEAEQDDK